MASTLKSSQLRRLATSLHTMAFSLIVIFLLTTDFEGAKESRDEALVTMDGERISSTEFRHRYEGVLLVGGFRDSWTLRKRILDNMVNEKLIVRQAYGLGIGEDPEFQKSVHEITIQALLDGYREQVVIDRITVTEDELKQAFARTNTRVRARHLYTETESEANDLYNLLLSGTAFDSLARLTFADPTLASNGGDLGYFTWGEMDPAFEEVAFTLPLGAVSPPVKTDHGYSIIKVEDRITVPLRTEYEYLSKGNLLRRVVRGNKIIEEGQQFVRDLAASLEITFSHAVVERLLELWDPKEISDRLSRLPDLDLLNYKGNAWTHRELKDRLEYTSERQRSRVKSLKDLENFLRGLVVRDVLIVRAYEAGVDKDPEVQQKIRSRIDQYILQRWKRNITKSLELFVDVGSSDASILRLTSADDVPNRFARERYERYRTNYIHPAEITVREILVNTRTEAERLFAELQRGEDFSDLARKHSLRSWSAEQGGETGYRTMEEYGSTGPQLFAADIGSVVGPTPVYSYYGIFQVLGKHEPRLKTFEEAERQVKQEMVMEAKFQAYEKMIEMLRGQRTIVVNEDLLRSLSIP